MSLDWANIAADIASRRTDFISSELTRLGIDHSCVDNVLTRSSASPSDLQALDSAWELAATQADAGVLLALYTHARTWEAWEVLDDYATLLRGIATTIGSSHRAFRPSDLMSLRLVDLVLRQTSLLSSCIDVENAMNSSSGLALQKGASSVVAAVRGLRIELQAIESPSEAKSLIGSVLDANLAFYHGLLRVGEALSPWQSGADGWKIKLARTCRLLQRLERTPAMQDDVYGSELSSHRHTLERILAREEQSTPSVRIAAGQVIYQYPFALSITAVELLQMLSGMRSELRGRFGSPPELAPTSFVWGTSGAGGLARAASYRLFLGNLTVTTSDGAVSTAYRASLRLGTFGNCVLLVEADVVDAGPHELNQALRRGSPRMGAESVRSGDLTFSRLSNYADNTISDFVAMLRNAYRGDIEIIGTREVDYRVILYVRKAYVVQERRPVGDASPDDLAAAVGALLFQPVASHATALEEWTRTPTVATPKNLLEGVGPEGALLTRTSNSTVAYLPRTPNWSALGYLEMISFVDSLSPTLAASRLLLGRQASRLRHRLGLGAAEFTRPKKSNRREGLSSLELAEARIRLQESITAIRGDLADIHAVDLCRTDVYRTLLDRLYDATGLPHVENDLQTAMHQAEALYEPITYYLQLQEETQSAHYQRRLETLLAIVAVTSVTGVLTLVNDLFAIGGAFAAWIEVVIVIIVLIGVAVGVSELGRRRAQIRP